MEDSAESQTRLLGGRYRLDAEIGHGGMGIVYRATDLTMHRPVAVKLIRSLDGQEIDEEVAGRFLREAKNTARVQHENIIEIFDLGRSPTGDLYFVMELLEGESLGTRLRRDGRLPVSRAVHVASQICSALHVAHAAGVIHRDLKPGNVMLLRRADDADFVKVLDFGVAKSYSPDQQTQLTHTGMLVGTIEYMAPEQIMGRPVDGRTDMYSLGVVLYRALAGRPPFRDAGVPALINAHINVPPPSLLELVPEVGIELEQVVMRALAKEPAQRYASMLEMSAALHRVASARLPSFEYEAPSSSPDDSDPYVGSSDLTEVAPRPPVTSSFDDATVKMDRPLSPRPGLGAALGTDHTAVMVFEEATAKRSIAEELAWAERRLEAKTCAMCQTKNVLHARACAACGVSLAPEEQAAVRARVAAPPTAQAPAGALPTSGMYAPAPGAYPLPPPVVQPASYGAQPGPPYAAAPPAPPQQPYAGWEAPGPTAPRPPSVWERFLVWTGLRGH